jgi:hypothetical protein
VIHQDADREELILNFRESVLGAVTKHDPCVDSAS